MLLVKLLIIKGGALGGELLAFGVVMRVTPVANERASECHVVTNVPCCMPYPPPVLTLLSAPECLLAK